AVGADEVALHRVAARAHLDLHSAPLVVRNDVAVTRQGPADQVILPCFDEDSQALVAQGEDAVSVEADDVVPDRVAARLEQLDAVVAVGGDDAIEDHVGGRTDAKQDAVTGVAQGGRPGTVGADVAALDDVAGRAGAGDFHAVVAVGGNGVEKEEVVGGVVDVDSVLAVTEGAEASKGGADEVVRDGLPTASRDKNAVYGEAVDDQSLDRAAGVVSQH